jgi:outer membrane protein assembly factor BamB
MTAPAAAPLAVSAEPEMLVVALADRTLAAVSAADGVPRWQHAIPSLPSLLTVGAGRIYFGAADGAVYAYDLDGSEDADWRFDVRAETIGAPAVDDRCVYVALIDNSVRAFRRSIGNLCWLTPINLRPATGPVALADALGVVTATGTLVALDRKTGRPVGAPVTPPGAPGENRPRLIGAAAGADGTIYTLTISSGAPPTVTAFRRAAR